MGSIIVMLVYNCVADTKIPIVMLVVGGGTNTIVTILEALTHKIPVVIIGGSGRAADYVTEAMTYVGKGNLLQ